MTIEEFERKTRAILEHEDAFLIDVSVDFQCDQTGGFPVSLWSCGEVGKAWLAPNDFLFGGLGEDDPDREAVLQACADFGIRDFDGPQAYNAILEELGEDAVQAAYWPEGEESQGMGMGY